MNGSDPSSQTAQESAGFQTISGTKIITDSVNGGPQLVITKPTGTDWLTEEEIDLLIEKRRKREEKLKRRAKSSKAYSAVKATSAQASSFAKRFLVEGSTTNIVLADDERDEDDESNGSVPRWSIWAFGFLCVIVPVSVGTVSRYTIINPLLQMESERDPSFFALTEEQKEKAVEEISKKQKSYQFDIITDKEARAPTKTAKEQALEIEEEGLIQNRQSFSNALTDSASVLGLVIFLGSNRRNARRLFRGVTKRFNTLESSTQAFVMLLIADILVGYHSADGWITVLGALSHHYGMEENETLASLFVSIVPVSLDVIFKYWVFRYLRRLNPSTGVIFEEIDRH